MSWGLIRLQDQLALVFRYVDPSEGPSAKGARMRGTSPTAEDVETALERPNVTVRLEPGLAPIALAELEFERLKLPEEPPWLEHFRPRPAPRAWHRDPSLAGHFHPRFRGDVRVKFFFGAQKTVEQSWVRLRRAGVHGWEGTLLRASEVDASLVEGTPVVVRGVRGVEGVTWVSPVMIENALEWEGECSACGFEFVLEPVVSAEEALSTACAMCGEAQRFRRRVGVEEPRSGARWPLWIALAAIVMGLIAVGLLLVG